MLDAIIIRLKCVSFLLISQELVILLSESSSIRCILLLSPTKFLNQGIHLFSQIFYQLVLSLKELFLLLVGSLFLIVHVAV